MLDAFTGRPAPHQKLPKAPPCCWIHFHQCVSHFLNSELLPGLGSKEKPVPTGPFSSLGIRMKGSLQAEMTAVFFSTVIGGPETTAII